MRKMVFFFIILSGLFFSGCAENEAPKLNFGEGTIQIELGSEFTIPDCTGIDAEDGDLTCVISGDTVDTSVVGVYVVRYTVTDLDGTSIDGSLTVTVEDTTVPTIDVDDSQIVLEVNSDFVVPVCTATDNQGDISCTEVSNTVDISTLGSYSVSYIATDNADNSSSAIEIDVIIQDTTSPIIDVDLTTIVLGYDTAITYPICTVIDNYDGDLDCLNDDSNVDLSVPGTYNIIYSATDSSGNIAALKTVPVEVIDNVAPIVTFDVSNIDIEAGSEYTIPVCTAVDAIEGDVDCVVSTNAIDVSTFGATVVTVYAEDSIGNRSDVISYQVNVVDTVNPVIQLDHTELYVQLDEVFGGITCTVDDVTVSTCNQTGNVDSSVLGEKTIVYTATDAGGNTDEVTVVVAVLEETFVMYDNVLFNLKTGEVLDYFFETGNDIVIPDDIYGVPVTSLNFELTSETLYVNSVSIGGQIEEFNDCFKGVEVLYENIIITGDDPHAYADRWEETELSYPLYGEYYFDEYYGRIMGYTGTDLIITVPSTINGIPVVSIGANGFGSRIIDTITVPGTVLHIEDRAFNNARIETIIFEEGVLSIGGYAFQSNFLYNITIPQSVESIASDCFYGTWLAEIVFTGGNERFYGDWIDIGFDLDNLPESAYVFQDGLYFVPTANKIISAINSSSPVIVPATIGGIDVLEIGNEVFYNYPHTTITLPEGLKVIGKFAFRFSDLVSIEIPASVTTIEDSAFSYSRDLETITILGDSTRFDDRYEDIGFVQFNVLTENGFTYYSFGGITGYDPEIGGYDVVIPSTLGGVTITAIFPSAFDNMDILSIVIPETVDYIGGGAFYNTLLTEVTIPETVLEIGDGVFRDSPITSLTIEGDEIRFYGSAFYVEHLTTDIFGMYFDERTNTILGSDYTKIPTDLTIPSQINGVDVLYIGDLAFEDCQIYNLVFPEGLLGIGEEVFADMELETVSLPSTLRYIGAYAFNNNNLTGTLVLPADLTVMQAEAFSTNEIMEVVLPADFQFLNDRVFSNNSIATINLPNTLQVIGYFALDRNDLSGQLVLPSSLRIIDYGAFSSNYYTGITFNENLEYIGESAFWTNSITELVIPDSVTIIDRMAFGYNDITSLVLPANITCITYGSFMGNDITEVIIPDGVTSVMEKAFYSNLLTEVIIPEGVYFIGKDAFADNSITDITLPDSLMIIDDNAFGGQNTLLELTITASQIVINRFDGEWDRIS